MDLTGEFERERPRLTRIAARVLGDPAEAEDAVQQAWLRLARTDAAAVANLQGWLTTVVTRVCLDRLKAAVPVPVPGDAPDRPGADPDPAEEVALAESVGSALHLVLDRLSPAERVALVLHDSFAVDFATIAGILDCTPAAARKHASRARSKVAAPPGGQGTADWDVVDAFLAAARDGEFSRLLGLLAPDVVVAGDPVAVGLGTPARIEGRDAVAEFFNGAAADPERRGSTAESPEWRSTSACRVDWSRASTSAPSRRHWRRSTAGGAATCVDVRRGGAASPASGGSHLRPAARHHGEERTPRYPDTGGTPP